MTKAALSQSKLAIVGAGLMGRMLAVALAKRGAQVDIFDQTGPEAKQAAAKIAAAMLAPLAESAITEDVVVQMGIYSLPRWKTLISELSNPVFFQQDGTIIVWHRQDSNDAERFTAHLHKNSLRNPKLPQAQVLDHEALQNIEPEVAERFYQGLYLPNEGQLDNRQLLDALVVELDLLSVNCHWHSPINPESLRDLGIYTQVVDCRGLGAQADWNQPSKTLRGVRGEVIRLYAPEVKLRRPTR
jgi:glycine oxidase